MNAILVQVYLSQNDSIHWTLKDDTCTPKPAKLNAWVYIYIYVCMYVCMYTQNTSVSFYIHIYKHRYVQYSYKHMDLPLYSYNATATLSYFQPRRVHNVNQAHMSLPKVTRINGTEATQCSSTIPAHHAEKRRTQPGWDPSEMQSARPSHPRPSSALPPQHGQRTAELHPLEQPAITRSHRHTWSPFIWKPLGCKTLVTVSLQAASTILINTCSSPLTP